MTEIVIDPESDLFYKDPIKWLEGLRNFLFTEIIPKALPNDNKNRDKYGSILISENAMNVWIVTFTDQSVDRNTLKNNQVLEMLGDRQLESLFTNLVYRLYPQITEDLLTELKSTYMSKNSQKNMANKLGLNKWVRNNFDNTIHTSEDLFEALFGGLFVIGEEYIGKGNGYALCNNLITSLYYDLEIDPDAILLRPITQVKEIIEKLGWGDRQEQKFDAAELGTIENIEDDTSDYKWSLTLKLTKNAKLFIKNILKREIVNGGILANTVAANKDTLKNNAFSEALKNLKEFYGVDHKWAVNYAQEELEGIIKLIAKTRMEQDKIVKVYFAKIMKTGTTQFLQLVGIDNYNNHIILISVVGNFKEPVVNLKQFAVKFYSDHGKISSTQPIVYKSDN